MPLLTDIERWVRDRVAAPDENIRGIPKEQIKALDDVLERLTAADRERELERVKASADYYYLGRHKQAVPEDVRESLKTVAKRSERLGAVDNARQVLERLGGPPTKQTLADALERSEKERESIRQTQAESIGVRMRVG